MFFNPCSYCSASLSYVNGPHVTPALNFVNNTLIKQRFRLVANLHVPQLRGQFCLFLGGPKTIDNDLPFTKCILTFSIRDRFNTPKARPLYSSLINGSLT